MDFKDLSYILAIEKHGNITKAAEALYLSQPSLSRFLQNVEKEIGQPLFRRVGNRYIPTYMGERYLVTSTKSEFAGKGVLKDTCKYPHFELKDLGIPASSCRYRSRGRDRL